MKEVHPERRPVNPENRQQPEAAVFVKKEAVVASKVTIAEGRTLWTEQGELMAEVKLES